MKTNSTFFFSYIQNGIPFNEDFIYFLNNKKNEFSLLEHHARRILIILSFLWIDLLPLIYMNSI